MIETDSDLAAFSDPSEFGTAAVLSQGGVTASLTGIMDTYHDMERPAATSNSGRGSFVVGAADMSMQPIQYLVAWSLVAWAKAEAELTVAAGPYTGAYRVKGIERDGELCRLILTKQR